VSKVSANEIAIISRQWLADSAGGTILVARHGGEPLAAALVIVYRDTAYLPMIPSSRPRSVIPASHLLVWEAMRWAKRRGCKTFDLGGYSLVARPGDSLWGINQFKRGFASVDHMSKAVAIHERVFSPAIVASAKTLRKSQAWWRRYDKGADQ
jgi:lipid II:glycine glycyltransferase (peptidoglycan interpeptide bridge formation enzyme)